MKQLILFDRKFNLRDVLASEKELDTADIVSAQKITFETPFNIKIEQGDILLSKETGFLGTVLSVEKGSNNLKKITVGYIDELFNLEVLIDNLIGNVFNWIKTTIETNIINNADPLLKLPIILENNMQTNYVANIEFKSNNLKECLKSVFDITGTFLEFEINYINGKPTALICRVKNNNDVEPKKIKYNLPNITNIKRTYTQSQNINKLILKPETNNELPIISFYLLKNGGIVRDQPENTERFSQVNQKILTYKDESTAEELVDIAKQELQGQEYNHNIQFDMLQNNDINLNLYNKVSFIDVDTTYNSIVSKIEVKNKIKTITLGVVRKSLTDKLKNSNTATTSAVSSGSNGGVPSLIKWGDISGQLTDQTDLVNTLNNYALVGNLPTKTSDLTNDSNFATTSQIPNKLSDLSDDTNITPIKRASADDDGNKINTTYVKKESGKGLSTNDFTDENKLNLNYFIDNFKNTAYRGHVDNLDTFIDSGNYFIENSTLLGYPVKFILTVIVYFYQRPNTSEESEAVVQELFSISSLAGRKFARVKSYDGIWSDWEEINIGLASTNVVGGITASPKTESETQEVKIDNITGKLYVPSIPAGIGAPVSQNQVPIRNSAGAGATDSGINATALKTGDTLVKRSSSGGADFKYIDADTVEVGNSNFKNIAGNGIDWVVQSDENKELTFMSTESSKKLAISSSGAVFDKQNGGFAGGNNAIATMGGAVGGGAETSLGFAGGYNAKAATGAYSPIDAIQLGTGTNNTAKTLQIYNHRLMNADGSIPVERLATVPAGSLTGKITPARLTAPLRVYGNNSMRDTTVGNKTLSANMENYTKIGFWFVTSSNNHNTYMEVPVSLFQAITGSQSLISYPTSPNAGIEVAYVNNTTISITYNSGNVGLRSVYLS